MRQALDGLGGLLAGPRPMKALSKDRLLSYHKADPSPEATWDVGKEILARVTLGARLDRDLRAATSAKRTAEMRLETVKAGGDPGSIILAERTVEKTTKLAATLAQELADDQAAGRVLIASDVTAWNRGRFWNDYAKLESRFRNRDLFRAQLFGFHSFLTCDLETFENDRRAFWEFEALAATVEAKQSPTYREAWALYVSRILPSLAERAALLDEDGQLESPAQMDKPKRRAYWKAFREFYLFTIRYNWAEDGGLTADPSFREQIKSGRIGQGGAFV